MHLKYWVCYTVTPADGNHKLYDIGYTIRIYNIRYIAALLHDHNNMWTDFSLVVIVWGFANFAQSDSVNNA